MRYTIKQVVIAGIAISLLLSFLLEMLAPAIGFASGSFWVSFPCFLLVVAASHIVLKEHKQQNIMVYNQQAVRHYIARWLLLFAAILLSCLMGYVAGKIENSSYGAGILLLLFLIVIFGIYYLFLIIETVRLLIKKRFKKAYGNILIIVASIVVGIVLN